MMTFELYFKEGLLIRMDFFENEKDENYGWEIWYGKIYIFKCGKILNLYELKQLNTGKDDNLKE
jgi:hypothetical protein